MITIVLQWEALIRDWGINRCKSWRRSPGWMPSRWGLVYSLPSSDVYLKPKLGAEHHFEIIFVVFLFAEKPRHIPFHDHIRCVQLSTSLSGIHNLNMLEICITVSYSCGHFPIAQATDSQVPATFELIFRGSAYDPDTLQPKVGNKPETISLPTKVCLFHHSFCWQSRGYWLNYFNFSSSSDVKLCLS